MQISKEYRKVFNSLKYFVNNFLIFISYEYYYIIMLSMLLLDNHRHCTVANMRARVPRLTTVRSEVAGWHWYGQDKAAHRCTWYRRGRDRRKRARQMREPDLCNFVGEFSSRNRKSESRLTMLTKRSSRRERCNLLLWRVHQCNSHLCAAAEDCYILWFDTGTCQSSVERILNVIFGKKCLWKIVQAFQNSIQLCQMSMNCQYFISKN